MEGLDILVPTEYNSAMVQLRNGDGSSPSVTHGMISIRVRCTVTRLFLLHILN